MTLDEALRAYTREGAYAEFSEDEKGALVAGRLADMVVFDQDLFQLATAVLHSAKVRMTVGGGQIR